MRKKMIPPPQEDTVPRDEWIDLEQVAEARISSEDPVHPIESALLRDGDQGWRAAEPGKQIIRLVFDEPRPIRRIWLQFIETDAERTQEFVIRWSPDRGKSFRKVVRQQWNFNPGSAAAEVEDFRVDLDEVTILELVIDPDIGGRQARASLNRLRVA